VNSLIVIIPNFIVEEALKHASIEPEREVSGVFIGRTLDRRGNKNVEHGTFIEICDIIRNEGEIRKNFALLDCDFLLKVSKKIERDPTLSIKGSYHSHPPKVFPLRFSNIDKRTFLKMQELSDEPMVSLLINPVSKEYKIITIDKYLEEINLVYEIYKNLYVINYGYIRGFDRKISNLSGEQREKILDNLSKKYEAKEELNKLSKAIELLDDYRHIKEIEEFISKVNELHEHYYTEKFDTVSSSVYSLKEEFKELWRKIEKSKKTQKKGEKNKPYRKILVLENLIEKYYKEHWKESQEDLSFILNGKIKKECGIPATFSVLSKNLKFNKKLKNLFKGDYDKKMEEIERSIKKFIVNKIGEEGLKELKKEVNK